jgi:hypothetical protein
LCATFCQLHTPQYLAYFCPNHQPYVTISPLSHSLHDARPGDTQYCMRSSCTTPCRALMPTPCHHHLPLSMVTLTLSKRLTTLH